MSAPAPTAENKFDLSDTPNTPLGRLVAVEWRKMLDTRAGLWLGISTALLTAVTMVGLLLYAVLGDNTLTASGFVVAMAIPIGILLPVVAILSVTSEWNQRTALVTFALEPRRVRSVGAKLCAVLLLAFASMLCAVALGALGNGLYGLLTGNEVVWNVGVAMIGGVFLLQVLNLLMGFGIGLMVMNTPGAITLFFVFNLVLPLMVYSTIIALTSWGEDVIPWIDLSTATENLSTGTMGGADWAHTLVTTAIFVLAPLAVGLRRLVASEIK